MIIHFGLNFGLYESGGWVIFNHMEIVFVVGLPLSLAKKAPGHAGFSCIDYLMFNTFINTILTQWHIHLVLI